MSFFDDRKPEAETTMKFNFTEIMVLMISGSIINGIVLCITWDWFVHGWFAIRSLSVPEAVGLWFMISAFQRRTSQRGRVELRVWHDGVVISAIIFQLLNATLVVLLPAWIAHLFL